MCAWIYGCNDAINSPLKIWGYIGLLRPRITTCYALQKTYRRNRRQNARRASVRSPRSGTEGRTALALACLPAIGVASEATPFLVLGEGYKKTWEKGRKEGRYVRTGKTKRQSGDGKWWEQNTRQNGHTVKSARARALSRRNNLSSVNQPLGSPKEQRSARARERTRELLSVCPR